MLRIARVDELPIALLSLQIGITQSQVTWIYI